MVDAGDMDAAQISTLQELVGEALIIEGEHE